MQKHFAYVGALLWRRNKKVAYSSQNKERKTWTENSEKVESGPGSFVSATVK